MRVVYLSSCRRAYVVTVAEVQTQTDALERKRDAAAAATTKLQVTCVALSPVRAPALPAYLPMMANDVSCLQRQAVATRSHVSELRRRLVAVCVVQAAETRLDKEHARLQAELNTAVGPSTSSLCTASAAAVGLSVCLSVGTCGLVDRARRATKTPHPTDTWHGPLLVLIAPVMRV